MHPDIFSGVNAGLCNPLSYPLCSPLEWSKAAAQETVKSWIQMFGVREREFLISGTSLFREGDSVRDMFLLTEGLILLSRTGPEDDSDCVWALRLPGQIIDPYAHNLGIPHLATARAIVASRVFRIPAPELQIVVEQDARTAAFFHRLLCLDLYNTTLSTMQLRKSSPTDRLKKFLRLLVSVIDPQPKSGKLQISMPLRDNELADMLGISARQFKRIKRQLQDAGYLRIAAAHVWSFAERP